VSGLRKDQRIEVTVERAVYRGQGLARHDGQVVFVPRGLPGDVLRVRVASVTPGYVKAEIEEVVTAGPGRSDARCPHFSQCGGCAYQHLDPAAQAALKESVLRDALRRAGTAWEGPIAVRPSPPEGWRTRATLHVEQGRDGGVRLGFHREASHDVVDIERCLQLSAPMMAGARGLRDALGAMLADKNVYRSPGALGPAYEDAGKVSDADIETYLRPLVKTEQRLSDFQRFLAAFDNKHTLAIEGGLKALKAPTQIIWGTDDVYFGVQWGRWLANAIPGTKRLVELTGARIFFPEERWAEFNRELRGFWQGD